MIHNEIIVQAIMGAIDELNGQRPREEQIEKSIGTLLFDSGGSLDSLGLISLVTTVEQKIEERLGATVTLLEDIADLEDNNPFRTVTSLAEYVASVLEKNTIE